MKNGLVKYFAGHENGYRYAGHYSLGDSCGRVTVVNTLDNKKYSADIDVRLCINLDKGWDVAEALGVVMDLSENFKVVDFLIVAATVLALCLLNDTNLDVLLK